MKAVYGSILFVLAVASALGQVKDDARPVVDDSKTTPAQVRDPKLPTLWIVGDSTLNSNAPLRGWGQDLAQFFDLTKVNVVNRAIGGRSSRTFQYEGRWDKVLSELKKGDFVLLQFGHNDVGKYDDPAAKDRPSLHSEGEETAEATRHAQKAADVFTKIMNVPDQAIPQSLLDKAEAIAVFPGVIKAGFIIGGRGGDGVISRRVPGGWSQPAFFKLGGGSVGLQIGASSTDFVMLFMNTEALQGLLEDKFEIGGEGSVAAGPVGRSASASTDAQLKAQILSYSRSKGLFAGLELKGVVINPDNDDNLAIYKMKAHDILTGKRKMTINQMPAGVRIFPRTLARYSTRR